MLASRFGRILKISVPLETNPRLVFVNQFRRFPPARFNSSLPAANSPPSSSDSNPSSSISIQPRLSITFTCAVPDCSHRSTHEFSKRSYERGIVIIQCPNCKNRLAVYKWFRPWLSVEKPWQTFDSGSFGVVQRSWSNRGWKTSYNRGLDARKRGENPTR